MKKLGWIIAAVMLMAFQCTKDTDDPVVDQDILFARIYENHAWGHLLEGWFIDHTGVVRGFSLSRNPEMNWKSIHDGGLIAEADLLTDYAQTDTTYTTIPLPDLFNYYSFIPEAAEAP